LSHRSIVIVSRKAHGTYTGVLTLTHTAAHNDATIEPRSAGGGGHQIVFRFNNPVTSATMSGTDAMDVAVAGAIASPSFSGNDLIVTLSNIDDAIRVKVKAANVNGLINVETPVAFLYGDVSQTGKVTAADISALKARGTVMQVGATNYRYDINANGGINNTDISAVKARSGTVLP
jgi:hypothetical protein